MSENFVTYFFLEFHVRYIELEINCEDTFDKKDFRDFSISSFLPNVHWIYYYLKWKAKFYWDEIYIGILYKYIHTYYYIHLFYSKSISNVKRFGCFTKLTNSIKRTGGVILCIYTLSSREVFAWWNEIPRFYFARTLFFVISFFKDFKHLLKIINYAFQTQNFIFGITSLVYWVDFFISRNWSGHWTFTKRTCRRGGWIFTWPFEFKIKRLRLAWQLPKFGWIGPSWPSIT